MKTRQPCQVYSSFRLPGACPCTEREHMARTNKVGGLRRRINRCEDRGGAVSGRNPLRGSLPRLNAHTKGGFKSRAVLRDYYRDFERVEVLGCHRQANQSAALLRHEVNGFGCDLLGSDSQITFVFAVFIGQQRSPSALRVWPQ